MPRPLIDLHRHLEGALRPSQLVEAALRSGVSLATPREVLSRVVADESVDSLRSYLTFIDRAAAYLTTLEDWREAGKNAVEDAFNDGLDYVELRYSPWFITSQTGLDAGAVTEAINDGITSASRAYQLPVGQIAIVVRDLGADSAQEQMNTILSHADVWCGVDMAGNEDGIALGEFAPAFARARDAGMHVTIHAGEAGGPENVRLAVTKLGAERIGHGVRSAEDPSLMELLAERGVTLETALTSNVQTAASPASRSIRFTRCLRPEFVSLSIPTIPPPATPHSPANTPAVAARPHSPAKPSTSSLATLPRHHSLKPGNSSRIADTDESRGSAALAQDAWRASLT